MAFERFETKIEAVYSGWTNVQMNWTIFAKFKTKSAGETTLVQKELKVGLGRFVVKHSTDCPISV